MRVSLHWLQNFVEIPDSDEDLAEKLSMAGFEVEAIEDVAEGERGVVVGYVESLKKHPNADKLKICQVDIADTYEHKHQEVSKNNRQKGLSKMTIDISKALFRKLATQGHVFSNEKFRTLKATYYRRSLEYIDIYKICAII